MNVLTYLDSLGSDVFARRLSNGLRHPANRSSHCRQIRLNSGQTLVHMLTALITYILCRGGRGTCRIIPQVVPTLLTRSAPLLLAEMEVIRREPVLPGIALISRLRAISVPREDWPAVDSFDPEALSPAHAGLSRI